MSPFKYKGYKVTKGLLLVSFFALFFLAGCGPRLKLKDFNKISIGMSKEQVITRLGEPDINQGSTINEKGYVIDVWEYNSVLVPLNKEEQDVFLLVTLGLGWPLLPYTGQYGTYWLYFVDNLLSQWGTRTAWQKQSDHVQEIRFR